MKVLTISGKAQHGKDSAAMLLYELLQRDGKKVLVCHYADLLKYICKTFFNWDGEKDTYGRELLQAVGTDYIRVKYNKPNYWVDFICDILTFFNGKWDYVIIPDTRFQNEIDRLNEREFDVKTIKVIRPSFDSGLTEKQLKHPSETALDNYKFDYTLINDRGLYELKNEVYKIVMEIENEYN